MSPCVIELDDSEVRVAQGGKVILRSPGYALVRGGTVCFGEEAVRLARRYPREAYHRFWANLSQDALRAPTRRFRHNADLAYAHLLALHEQAGKPGEVIFAVPGSFSTEQLALLLGIVQACPFKAVGLVDSAVAGAAAVAGPGRYVHVATYLHQTVLTRLAVREQVVREGVEIVDNGGVTAIHDAAADLIADTLIQQSRFDPLHHADTEQALYDQLPGCLRALTEQPEVLVAIKLHQGRHQAKLSRDALRERLEHSYASVVQRLEPDRACLVTDRVAGLPGFVEEVPAARVLEPDAVFRAVERHQARIRSRGPNLSFITRLPASPEPAVTAPADGAGATAAPSPAATHVLLGHAAFPLREGALYLSTRASVSRVRQASSACVIVLNSREPVISLLSDVPTYVNGERLAGSRTLAAGDQVSFADADAVYALISEVGLDGP